MALARILLHQAVDVKPVKVLSVDKIVKKRTIVDYRVEGLLVVFEFQRSGTLMISNALLRIILNKSLSDYELLR